MGVTIRDPRKNGILELAIHWGGKRRRRSLGRISWEEAREEARAVESLLRAGVADPVALGIRFEEMAERYLREATGHLAPTTRAERERLLEKGGRVRAHFEGRSLEAVRRADLVEWWAGEVEGRGLSAKTGRNDLDALAGVFAYAVDLELVQVDPVAAFRPTLRRRLRSKRTRAESDPGKHVRPIEKPRELAAFVKASAARGGNGHALDLLQLDAGLRFGEAAGLAWADVVWGQDADDLGRALRIRTSRPRGAGAGEAPKSGRERAVALSRRLRAVLLRRWIEAGRPMEGRVVPFAHASNYRKRHFMEVCRSAKLGHRRAKDLRDTFASQLLTAGISPGYVSLQLGHSDLAVTARHYARYIDAEGYRKPLQVRRGEVPADLLSRLDSAGAYKRLHSARKRRPPRGPGLKKV